MTKALYRCVDCGHEQYVSEVHTEDGSVYAGSGANWCDECEVGKPERVVPFDATEPSINLEDEKMTDKTEFPFMQDWPIIDTMDFEGVVISATRWDSGEYTAMINLYHVIAEDGTGNAGMTLATHIGGLTLRELYLKIETLIDIGLFDGTEVDDHGTLFDERGNELATICWHQLSDDEWEEDDDDMSALSILIESDFPPPTMIQ